MLVHAATGVRPSFRLFAQDVAGLGQELLDCSGTVTAFAARAHGAKRFAALADFTLHGTRRTINAVLQLVLLRAIERLGALLGWCQERAVR